jgi:hypothetical protein
LSPNAPILALASVVHLPAMPLSHLECRRPQKHD